MKATIEIPDDLYRRVKSRCALEGRPIREVTESLYRAWLEDETKDAAIETAQAWLDGWLRLGDEALRAAPLGPTARELLAEGRRRLDDEAVLGLVRQAAETGRSMTEIIETALREHLERERRRDGKGFALRWAVVPGGPQPGVDVADRDRLDERMNERTGKGS